MSAYTPTTEEVRLQFCWDIIENEYTRERQQNFDRWLAELIRTAKAEAWDEGYVSSDDYYGNPDNPYRQGETE